MLLTAWQYFSVTNPINRIRQAAFKILAFTGLYFAHNNLHTLPP